MSTPTVVDAAPRVPPAIAWTLRDGDDLDFGYTDCDPLYEED